jgi:hypothetical protein
VVFANFFARLGVKMRVFGDKLRVFFSRKQEGNFFVREMRELGSRTCRVFHRSSIGYVGCSIFRPKLDLSASSIDLSDFPSHLQTSTNYDVQG